MVVVLKIMNDTFIFMLLKLVLVLRWFFCAET
jgi:hypothetical protein